MIIFNRAARLRVGGLRGRRKRQGERRGRNAGCESRHVPSSGVVDLGRRAARIIECHHNPIRPVYRSPTEYGGPPRIADRVMMALDNSSRAPAKINDP